MHEIIWTRSVANWENDKKLFQKTSVVHHYPCIQQEVLMNIPTAQHAQHFIITSKFALECLQKHKQWWDLFCKPEAKVWCFGQSVFKKIESHRKSELVESCKNASELARYLSKTLPKDSNIIFFGAEQTAFDMTGFLKKEGFSSAKKVTLYKTLNPIQGSFSLEDKTRYKIAFASPSAAKNFFLKNKLIPNMEVFCIGSTTKQALPKGVLAKTPLEQSIESLIKKIEKT